MKFVHWTNRAAQLAFFINEEYWMPFAKIYIKATSEGFSVMLADEDMKWKTEAIFAKEE